LTTVVNCVRLIGCQGDQRIHLWRYGSGISGEPWRRMQTANDQQLARHDWIWNWISQRIQVDITRQSVHHQVPVWRYMRLRTVN